MRYLTLAVVCSLLAFGARAQTVSQSVDAISANIMSDVARLRGQIEHDQKGLEKIVEQLQMACAKLASHQEISAGCKPLPPAPAPAP